VCSDSVAPISVSGTSYSSAFVAGAACLVRSENPSLTPAEVREQLVTGASPVVTATPPETTNLLLFTPDSKIDGVSSSFWRRDGWGVYEGVEDGGVIVGHIPHATLPYRALSPAKWVGDESFAHRTSKSDCFKRLGPNFGLFFAGSAKKHFCVFLVQWWAVGSEDVCVCGRLSLYGKSIESSAKINIKFSFLVKGNDVQEKKKNVTTWSYEHALPVDIRPEFPKNLTTKSEIRRFKYFFNTKSIF